MDFKIAFTDKEITAWGGMIFMKKLIEKSGIADKLNELELPAQGSNRGIRSFTTYRKFLDKHLVWSTVLKNFLFTHF